MCYEHGTVVVDGLRMHYVVEGSGPPVLLLHGFPQTWYMWRHLIGPLAERYTVIAPDLRGYGLTDKPRDGYDKRTMAADVRALAAALGHEHVALVGHDRGARVAHRYALDHPTEVDRLAVLDIVPTRSVFQRMDAQLATGYWHWLFHLQPDLPELLVGDRVEVYLRYLISSWAYRRDRLEEAIPVYVQAFAQPGALRAAFDDYRATLDADIADDDRTFDAGERLAMPLLAMWGEAGLISRLPVLDIWREYADDVRGGGVPECGHFLPEERPELVLGTLQEFLAGDETSSH